MAVTFVKSYATSGVSKSFSDLKRALGGIIVVHLPSTFIECNMEKLKELAEKSNLIRKWCLVSTTEAESGHPTSCLSSADITTVLFDRYFTYDLSNPLNLYNDRLVLSKGHAAPLLYALFAVAGAYPLEELKTLRKF